MLTRTSILSFLGGAVIAAGVTAASPVWAGRPLTLFEICERDNIPQLDDHISPADVIAAGVVEACRPILHTAEPTMNDNAFEIMVTTLKQAVIPDVLAHRASMRKQRAAGG